MRKERRESAESLKSQTDDGRIINRKPVPPRPVAPEGARRGAWKTRLGNRFI